MNLKSLVANCFDFKGGGDSLEKVVFQGKVEGQRPTEDHNG